MRILYHSAAPWVNTGYGRCTREVASRLQNMDHDISIQAMSSLRKDSVTWHGEQFEGDLDDPIEVYPVSTQFGLGDVADHYGEADADFYFTHFDTWMKPARESIPEMEIPYASYVIVDHYPAPRAVTNQVRNATETVAMSKWAKTALMERGLRPIYIPHGVHTDKYHPLPEEDVADMRVRVKGMSGESKDVRVGDRTIIGMVAANHGDRKHIPGHMEAFSYYLKEVDSDALLYIHTDPNAREGFNLDGVRKELGIPAENVLWSRPEDYHNVEDEYLNRLYNAFDVMLNCSMGESWGLTITEAQSAGTPVIANNFSSMPEQLGSSPSENNTEGTEYENVTKAPHGVLVDPIMGVFREKVSSKQYYCHPEDIFKAIKWYTERPETIERDGDVAQEFVRDNYDWEENVIPRFNQMLNNVEKLL